MLEWFFVAIWLGFLGYCFVRQPKLTIGCLAIAMVVILSGCGSLGGTNYLELGTGKHTAIGNNAWDDCGTPAFYGSLRHERRLDHKRSLVVMYNHHSQWVCGPPFNDKSEDSLDYFGGALKMRLGD